MTDAPNPRAVACSECGAYIGEYVERNGRVWLKVGGMPLRYFSGVCPNPDCEQEITYSTTDKTLEQLFERRNRVMKLEVSHD